MKTEPNVLFYTNLAKERICYCLVKVRDGPHPPLLTVNFFLSVINDTEYLILVDIKDNVRSDILFDLSKHQTCQSDRSANTSSLCPANSRLGWLLTR